MNAIKKIISISCLAILFACKKNKETEVRDDLKNLFLTHTVDHEGYKIKMYTKNGKLETGYNLIYIKISDQQDNLIKNVNLTWLPMMHMEKMQHSCPFSEITKKEDNASIHQGYIIFQMASNEKEYWELTLNYTINDVVHTVKEKIFVTQSEQRNIEVFRTADKKLYVLAMIDPAQPKIGVNDMSAVLYQMESMQKFVPVKNYTIKIDPRMPGMGNHGSPNNTDLVQGKNEMYDGKLNFTMTGFWKINLQLLDESKKIIKGETVSSTQESSSIFFAITF